MKGIVPLVGLVATTLAIRIFSTNQRELHPGLNKRRRARVNLTHAIISTALFLLVCLLCVQFNLPSHLQETHPDIVQAKHIAREACSAALQQHQFLDAENAMRNNTLSKLMHKTHTQQMRGSMDRVLRRVNNVVLFGFGTMYAVLPGLAAMLALFCTDNGIWFASLAKKSPSQPSEGNPPAAPDAQAASITPPGDEPNVQANTRSWILQNIGSDQHLWSVIEPVVNMGVAMAWIAYLAFYLWLEEAQITYCMLLSGHWYTFVCTSFACWTVSSVFVGQALNDNATFANICFGYLSYFALYVAMTFRVLINSQLFHHDDLESREGIKSALYVVPVMALVGMFVLSRGVDAELVVPGSSPQVDEVSQPSRTESKPPTKTSSPSKPVVSTEKADPPVPATKQADAHEAKQPIAPSEAERQTPPVMRAKPVSGREADQPRAPRPKGGLGFLGDIKSGVQLKSVDTNKSAPKPAPSPAEAAGSLASMLSSALNKRRSVVDAAIDEKPRKNSDDDDWEED